MRAMFKPLIRSLKRTFYPRRDKSAKDHCQSMEITLCFSL